MNWKRELVVWLVGNLAWMVTVYTATRVYYFAKRQTAEAIFTWMGTALVGAISMTTYTWLAPRITLSKGSIAYYPILALLSLGGAAIVGLLVITLVEQFDIDSLDSAKWYGHLLAPFYVSIFVVLVAMILSVPWAIVMYFIQVLHSSLSFLSASG